MKEATNILSDMKNLLTLGNSVSWVKLHCRHMVVVRQRLQMRNFGKVISHGFNPQIC